MLWRTLSLLLLVLLAASCGEEKDPKQLVDDARAALSQGEWAAAAKSADKAITELTGPGEAGLRQEALMYFVESSAYVTPALAKTRLMDWVKSSESEFQDFEHMVKKLLEAKAYTQASEVIATTRDLKVFPAGEIDPLGNYVADQLAAVEASGDSKASDALKGLGYTGNDPAPKKREKTP